MKLLAGKMPKSMENPGDNVQDKERGVWASIFSARVSTYLREAPGNKKVNDKVK